MELRDSKVQKEIMASGGNEGLQDHVDKLGIRSVSPISTFICEQVPAWIDKCPILSSSHTVAVVEVGAAASSLEGAISRGGGKHGKPACPPPSTLVLEQF